MINISQTTVAIYLHDYCALTSLMLENPDIKPIILFKKYLLESNREIDNIDEYYNRMLRIVYIFIKMKMFSIAEDYTLKQRNNFINNDDLDLSFLDSKIVGNRNTLSNKQLLRKLRDGFNHSEYGNEIYKISPNGKYIEFSFDEPDNIKIKLSLDDISSLTSAIGDAAKIFQFFSFEQPRSSTIKEYIDNLKITRHYFPKKVDSSIINSVLQHESDGNYNDAIDLVKEIDKNSEKEISLSDDQKNHILNNICGLIESNMMTVDEVVENLRDIIIILLNNELAVPILKLDNYLLDSYFVKILLPLKEFSYHQMLGIFIQGLKVDDANPVNKYSDIFDIYRQCVFKTYFSNPDEKLTYASLIFIEYIISNFKPIEEEITIDGQIIPYNKLRNSLVHGRWHLDGKKISLYDTIPNIEKELDFNWSIKLDLYSLYQYCGQVLQDKLYKENSKKLIKTILYRDYNK